MTDYAILYPMKQPSPPKEKWLRVPIPEEEHRIFKAQAYRIGKTMTDLIREFISACVRKAR